MIADKAQHFANICGCPDAAHLFTNQEWLKEFKCKHLVTGSSPKEHDGAECPRGTVIPVTPLPKALAGGLGYHRMESDGGNCTISHDPRVANADDARCALELVVSYFELQHSGLHAEDHRSINEMRAILNARSS